MTYLESIILTFFDAIFFMLITKKILEIKKFYWKDIIPLVIITAIIATGSNYIPEEYNFILSLVTLVIVFIIYYKLKPFQSFMLYVISSIIIIVIQLLVMLPIFLIFNEIQANFSHGIVAQSVGLILVLICYLFVPIHLIYRLANRKNRIIKILLINLFVLGICVLFYWYLDIDGMLENVIAFVGMALLMVVLNGVIIRNGLKSAHEEKQLGIYEKYLPVIEDLTDEIRKRQHDFNNHIQAIKSIQVAYDDLKLIREKTDSYSAQLNSDLKYKELLLLDNKILAGFLCSKLQQVNEREIRLEYNLANVKFKLMDYELIEIISILLDNAIEATKKEGLVQLSLGNEDNCSMIKVSNPSDIISMDDLNNFFRKGYSTKAEVNRGFGLSRLSDIVKKYDGLIQIMNEKNEKQQNNVVFQVSFQQ